MGKEEVRNFFKVEEVGRVVVGGVSIRRFGGLWRINNEGKMVEPFRGTVTHGGG